MATFPKLRTGAISQYPSSRSLQFSTHVVSYVDGSEQRFRMFPSAVTRWRVRLDQVSETELAAVAAFFEEQQGRFARFTFVDPWTGVEHVGCSFDQDAAEFVLDSEQAGRSVLVIRTNQV